ncbi:MAG: hypothetical protein Kow00124_27950 [Anaerolineae bacterium]
MTDTAGSGSGGGLEALYARAEDALRAGDLAKAETLYRLFLARAGDDTPPGYVAMATARLAQVHAQQGRYDEAAPLFAQAIDLMQQAGDSAAESVATYNFAAMRHQQGRIADAVALMERVVSLDEAIGHPDLESDRATLTRYRADLELPPPDTEAINLIAAFINAPNWDASRRVLEAHPELLEPHFDRQIRGLIEAARIQNPELARHLIRHRELLEHAREQGIDAAFEAVTRPPDEALVNALLDFLRGEDWPASRRVLEANPMLLSEEAHRLLEGLIQEAVQGGDSELAYHLSVHLDLLRTAAEVGYEEAFRRLEIPPDENLARLIAEMIGAGELSEVRAMLETHPELLSDEADNTFDALIQAALALADRDRAQKLIEYRDLVRVARRSGIEPTLNALEAQQESDEAVLDIVVVGVVAHNTIAVLTLQPDKLDDWLATVTQIRAEALEMGDASMVGLLDAVERLLRGEPFEAIQPALGEVYAAGWDQIGEGLRKFRTGGDGAG